MSKIIIAGSRRFFNYRIVALESMKFIIDENITNPTIISGNANGADRMGEIFAGQYGYPLDIYPADWEANGRVAGLLRNEEMAKHATHCIVFWDGASRGSAHMIECAKKYDLILKVINI